MELNELYFRIGLQEQIIQKLGSARKQVDLEQIDSYLESMMDMKTAAQAYRNLKSLLAEDTGNIKMLYCQLECARRVFEKYQEKHIPETIYTETMKCFTRFIEECQKRNGWMFFDRGWWTYRQVNSFF